MNSRASGDADSAAELAATVRPPPAAYGDPLIGLVVAERYRILELLGRGGMGSVYKVEHARIGKLMALKLLAGALARDGSLVARFEREAAMVSRLSHPNTVQVFDFGHERGLVYLAMEYLRGSDLSRVIREQGALTLERAAKLMVQVCSSVSEAHDKGIVHRDLKPENVMVLSSSQDTELVKVLDFGLAKLRESRESASLTQRGAIVGTPYYMSPEQIRGEEVGPAGDVYGLGALLYVCITGEVVFDGPSPLSILTKHLTEAPIPPSLRAPTRGIPQGFDRIVLRALAKDPTQRFASALALQQALLDELRGSGQPSVELLLDSRNLRELRTLEADAATRDEVQHYERKLRRRGYVAWATLASALTATAGLAYRAFADWGRPVPFAGHEREPNNSASTATEVPFPVGVKGQIGQRIDPERSDRDFYRTTIPASSNVLSLQLVALPNMALCVSLYPQGSDAPIGRYCPGGAGQSLDIRALRVAPGEYVLAVMQDREAYAATGAPPVHENISDVYELKLGHKAFDAAIETEPNDTIRDSARVSVGSELVGALTWMRDVDFVCAKEASGHVVFVVEDAKQRSRPRTAVLQVIPQSGADSQVPVRVHGAHTKAPMSARDVVGAWRSAPMVASDAEAACVELSLVPNPWADSTLPLVAPASPEQYVVRVEAK